MADQGFPHIHYLKTDSPQVRGQKHGEEFKKGIRELADIRRALMIQKSPHLKDHIATLAAQQYQITKEFAPQLTEELEGISHGANCTLEDLIILNNYTDFRDIPLVDEGCTSLSLYKGSMISAQTWDMHSSAKDYICTITLAQGTHVFSLVGCLGMMGVNRDGLFIGVNNLNTKDARPGIIWPAFVRKVLEEKSIEAAKKLLQRTPFTSGHNYLLSDAQVAEHWEASPTKIALAARLSGEGIIYHTNHCLHESMWPIEETLSQNSTSTERYQLLEKKKDSLQDAQDVLALLQDHEGYPKSLCGHYQSGATDPSTTCGGALYDYKTKDFTLWRGCKKYDTNYQQRTFSL